MNLTLGSSCPTYQWLSMKRSPLPSTTLIGSVHVSPACFLTDPYFGLQPLQSTSLTGLGATAPAVSAFAAAVVVAAVAEPVRLRLQTTAMPITGTSSNRHFRLPASGDPRPNLVDDPRPAQGMRMCDPSRSRMPPVPVRPLGLPVTPV